MLDLGGDLSLLPTKSKLLAKLVCVTVLSLNAVLLHRFAFPRLMSGHSLSTSEWSLVLCAGAVSTTSWLFAAFLGIAKPLAAMLSAGQFIGLYVLALAFAVGVAMLLANPLRRQLGFAQTPAAA